MFIISESRSGTKVHPSWIYIMWSEYISIKNLISPSLLALPWLIYPYSTFWLWRWSALTSCIWPKVQKIFSPLTRVQPQFSLTPTKTHFSSDWNSWKVHTCILVQIKLKKSFLNMGPATNVHPVSPWPHPFSSHVTWECFFIITPEWVETSWNIGQANINTLTVVVLTHRYLDRHTDTPFGAHCRFKESDWSYPTLRDHSAVGYGPQSRLRNTTGLNQLHWTDLHPQCRGAHPSLCLLQVGITHTKHWHSIWCE